jgi:hypothetical protein
MKKLHGDEYLLVLLADFIDRADVGMVQGRRNLCLALEARQSLRVPANGIASRIAGPLFL